jgi:TIR domain/AAA ATPase domain
VRLTRHVFISYGRRDASAFADRLATDLKSAGFTVWRDTDNLRCPDPWDEQLAAAIKQCDAVIAILTPHAVRTGREQGTSGDESVCLDELAFARFSPPPTPIVPLLLMPCEPPFVIFRLNYLDFLKAAADDVNYRAAFDGLVKTIQTVKAGKLPGYRDMNFEPLDFDIYLRTKTRDFVGREWLIGEVLDHLKASDAPRALLLVGDPGWGKTAFAAHLFSANPNGQLLAAHFCRADRADSIDPRRFVENLVAMTAMRIPDFELRINSLAGKRDELLRKAPVKDAFEQLYLEPLTAIDLCTLGELPRYILVDSLDEASLVGDLQSIGALLAQTIDMFPDWLKLVATSPTSPTEGGG